MTGPATTRILFVCTANRVRSPFAEAVARSMIAAQRLPVEVSSAGFLSSGLTPIDKMARVSERMGYSLSGHLSRTVDAAILGASDLTVAMTGAHVIDLVGIDPTAARRILTLRELAAAADTTPPPSCSAASVREWALGATDRPIARLLSGELDVVDPIGGPMRAYRRAATEIETLLARVFDCTGEIG